MAKFTTERVLSVHHWNESLFTFTTYRNRGRMTEVIESGRLFKAIGLPSLDAGADRFMVCGSPSMLKDVGALLDGNGFSVSPHVGEPGHYVIERAFVER
jgi:ferredoxin--NADP+ reductase